MKRTVLLGLALVLLATNTLAQKNLAKERVTLRVKDMSADKAFGSCSYQARDGLPTPVAPARPSPAARGGGCAVIGACTVRRRESARAANSVAAAADTSRTP
jgi:hypothetical protein